MSFVCKACDMQCSDAESMQDVRWSGACRNCVKDLRMHLKLDRIIALLERKPLVAEETFTPWFLRQRILEPAEARTAFEAHDVSLRALRERLAGALAERDAARVERDALRRSLDMLTATLHEAEAREEKLRADMDAVLFAYDEERRDRDWARVP
jgi:hypothetical protein